jgi:hypothetical protein
MTYEQAQEQEAIANEALGDNTETVKYGIFAFWPLNWVKNWDIVMYPTVYETQFVDADDSVKLAFQRVSAQTSYNIASGSSYDEWVTLFDTLTASDEELNNYLNG